MQFVAIDFETANSQPSSACQLAAVWVRDSQIVDERCWLIRPPRIYFSPRNIAVHGIRPGQVAQAPTMENVWNEIAELIEGEVIVAHNARFDLTVLLHSLAAFDIACPRLEFNCTRLLARRAWPGRSQYGLKPLGDWLGIDFRHHDALEDARCCAQVALAVAGTLEEQDLKTIEERLKVSRGRYQSGQLEMPRALGPRRRNDDDLHSSRGTANVWATSARSTRARLGSLNTQVVLSSAADEKPFRGKQIFLMGPLRGLSLEESKKMLEQLGATCPLQLQRNTDYVIACGTTLDVASSAVCSMLAGQVCEHDNQNAADPTASSTARGIRLLSERQFLALLPGGKAALNW